MNNEIYFKILETMKMSLALLLDLSETAYCEELATWNEGFDGYETIEKLKYYIDKMEKGDVL